MGPLTPLHYCLFVSIVAERIVTVKIFYNSHLSPIWIAPDLSWFGRSGSGEDRAIWI
jgi:hypothetical protein